MEHQHPKPVIEMQEKKKIQFIQVRMNFQVKFCSSANHGSNNCQKVTGQLKLHSLLYMSTAAEHPPEKFDNQNGYQFEAHNNILKYCHGARNFHRDLQ